MKTRFYKAILLSLILSICLYSCKNENKKIDDVIIIGAGLAGLSSSYFLNDYKTLLLEKNNYLGGRALTRKWKNYYYDLGANIPVAHEHYPVKINDKLINTTKGYQWIDETQRFLCLDPLECVYKLTKSKKEVENAIEFKTYKKDFSQLSSDNQKVMRRFFNTWYPNPIENNSKLIQRYFFDMKIFYRFEKGVGSIVNAFKEKLKNRYLLNHEVQKVNQLANRVEVICKSENTIHKHIAKVAIIATEPHIVKKLYKKPKVSTYVLLNSIKHYSSYGYSIIARGKDINIPAVLGEKEPFSFTTFYLDKEIVNFLFFFRADMKRFSIEHEQKLKDQALKSLDIALNGKKYEVLHEDLHHWPFITLDVSKSFEQAFKNFDHKVSKDIFLAGDYTNSPAHYGMFSAMKSGKYISELVKKHLRDKLKN